MPEVITDVAVGVICREDGQILIGSRPQGKPWAGWWELPGGKIEPGEAVLQALTRELKEEIDIEVSQAWPWVTHVHRYPTTTVRLHFCRVTAWQGNPTALENQRLQWIRVEDALERKDLLPATYPPLGWLQIPHQYLISGVNHPDNFPAFLQRLERAFEQGIRLVQWREPDWQQTHGEQPVYEAMHQVLALCQRHQARLMINSVHPESWWGQAHGVHLRARDALSLSHRPDLAPGGWVGVSTHDPVQLCKAREIGADFAVLGPVLPTLTHPDGEPLGWDRFETWNLQAGLPVFALGGQSSGTLLTAWSRGAHGIAGIRQLID